MIRYKLSNLPLTLIAVYSFLNSSHTRFLYTDDRTHKIYFIPHSSGSVQYIVDSQLTGAYA